MTWRIVVTQLVLWAGCVAWWIIDPSMWGPILFLMVLPPLGGMVAVAAWRASGGDY